MADVTGCASVRLDDVGERVLCTLLAMQRQSWEQGVASHAFLDLGLDDLAIAVARDSVTRQSESGKLADLGDVGAVNCGAAGEVVCWAAHAFPDDPGFAAAFDRQLSWLRIGCPRGADGTLFHLERAREVWVDTVYMVVPLLVLAGFVDEAAAQLAGHRRRLFDEPSGLYAARWDDAGGRLVMPAHWGTGNGWVVAGIARALRHLGSRAPQFRVEAAEHARQVIDGCLRQRADDGLFHNVVDDPTTFSEANLAQLLAYGCFTGVADGWLPDSYADTATSLLATSDRRVDDAGFVTGVCGAPHFDRPGVSAEAQAFFLLAHAAQGRSRAGRSAQG